MFKGEDIKKKRKALGFSAEKLAAVLQVSKESIYKWEKGTRPNNAEEYLRLENWLSGKLENVPIVPSKENVPKEEPAQTMTMQMLADVIKGNLELIENNKVLTRINEKHTNMLDEKLPPVNFDLIGLVETVKQLDAKVNQLLKPHIKQAEEDLKKEAGQFVTDRDKEARAIAERLRQSGKHGYGKPGKK